MSSFDVPRSVLLVVLALAKAGGAGSTYRGLRHLLGYRSEDAVRAAVRRARAYDAVLVVSTGRGQRAQSIVRLTPKSLAMLEHLELPAHVLSRNR